VIEIVKKITSVTRKNGGYLKRGFFSAEKMVYRESSNPQAL
jgi:hypothetical protein